MCFRFCPIINLTICVPGSRMTIMKKKIINGIIFVLGMGVLSNPANAYINRDNAVVRVMNKAAGKTQTMTLPVGQPVKFEKLEIIVRSCKQTDPFQAEDFFAFTQISTAADGLIFSNWLSRNEPGVTPLQNPDYDVWLVKCE